jgi:broad specificity phosphatase PhoE
MTPIKTLALSLLLCALSACASRPAATVPLEFVLVRHAEKADDDPRDPSLSDAGRARAQRLAESFAGREVFAVYATGYKRTRDTAGPTASAHATAVSVYDAKLPAAEFAAQLRRRHPVGKVLVVGHSNTVPDIAAALCGCEVAPMTDTEFDRRIVVDFDGQGRPHLSETRY